MRYQAIDNAFFARNRARLAGLMPEKSLAVVNAADRMPRSGDQCFPYRQHADLFYLTGIEQEGSIFMFSPHHEVAAVQEVLFILDLDAEAETRDGTRLTREQASQISGIVNVQWMSSFPSWLHRMMLDNRVLFLNIYEYPKFQSDIVSRDHRFAQQARQQYPAHTFDRLGPLMIKLRMVKDETETGLISRAIDISAGAFARVARFMHPGIMEYELEAELMHEFVRHGCTGAAYIPIIASGNNACILHYTSNDAVCRDGELVLIDMGAEYANYAADLSRTLPVNGRFNARQRQLYDAVHRVMQAAKQQFFPGNTIEKVNKAARLLMADELARLGLIAPLTLNDEKAAAKAALRFMVHGITHHIGLDVHDLVDPAEPLQPGMIMTCEPGLYLPEEGIGIRIENDILVADPPVDLMAHIPSEAGAVEELMHAN